MAVVFEGNECIQDTVNCYLWAGFFSVATNRGSIMRYTQQSVPQNMVVCVPQCDGNIQDEHSWQTEVERYRKYAKEKNKVFVVGTLANKFEMPNTNYLYLPLDDGFFEHGMDVYMRKEVDATPWESRSSQLCWRGGCSGGGLKSLRVRFVDTVYQYNKNTDVRLTRRWSENQNIPEHLFDHLGRDTVHHTEFFNHKIFFIVDGNVIASNHMYGFGSGAVPFLISNGICWFTHLIKPFVHYVPIKYDLSDLVEKIEWVHTNDGEARTIASNALDFSRTCFSATYQHGYIRNKLNSFV